MQPDSQQGLRSSATLLERVQTNDPKAWAELVRRYGPLLYKWGRGWNLHEVDAQDLTQEVLLKLYRRFKEFRYDPAKSFRAYLKTLARYAWCDLLADRRNQKTRAMSGKLLDLDAVAVGDDLARQLEEEYDRELLARAMEVVRTRVEAHTWGAFQLTALEGLSGADAAGLLGMTVTSVFKARSRVQRMLKEEVATREDD